MPGLDLTQVAIPLEHLALLPREIAVRHVVLPVLVQDERIFLAMANPEDKRVIDELEFVTGKRVFPYVAPEPILAKVIEASYELKTRGESYYLGPMVPQEVLVKLGLAEAPVSSSPPIAPPPRPPPPALPPRPPLRRHASDDRMPASIIAEKLEREAGPENSLLEGDFSGGSDLSTVGAVPLADQPVARTAARARCSNGKTVLVVDDEDDIRKPAQARAHRPRLQGARGRPRLHRPAAGQGAGPRSHHPRRHAPRAARLRDLSPHQGLAEVRSDPHHHGERGVSGLALRRGPAHQLRRRRLHREAVPHHRGDEGRRAGHPRQEGRQLRGTALQGGDQRRGREVTPGRHRRLPGRRHRHRDRTTCRTAHPSTRWRIGCTTTSGSSMGRKGSSSRPSRPSRRRSRSTGATSPPSRTSRSSTRRPASS